MRVALTYFADGRKAVGNGWVEDWPRDSRLSALVGKLIEAVQKQDSDMLLQLEPEIDKLHKLFLNEH